MSTLRDDSIKNAQGKSRKAWCSIKSRFTQCEDLSLAYSPGVAEPCLDIYEDESKVYDYTMKGNLVAVVSNGTAVLDLEISDRKLPCRLWREKQCYSSHLPM